VRKVGVCWVGGSCGVERSVTENAAAMAAAGATRWSQDLVNIRTLEL
jgi:hypothetical protein